MQYTQYGQTGLRVSRFGLGCMRFPKDVREAVDMVRYAIDHGVNYLDTAYVYPDSEVTTGKALAGGYREKIVLATKSPVWLMKRYEDYEKYLDEELKRLHTDTIDVYLLHCLTPENWETVKRTDGLRFLDRMAEKGKIRHRAFSIHSTYEHYLEVANAYDWEMAQIQLNILDEHRQAGLAGVRHAAGKKMATVVMEPLRGGSLVNNVPPEVQALVEQYPEKRSLVEWCFRWLYNLPEVTLILSGTSSMAQLQENLRIFENAQSGVMSEKDLSLIAEITDRFEARRTIGCTGCRYCMPCPSGVAIPDVFSTFNRYLLTARTPADREAYRRDLLEKGTGGDRCVACGACAKHCPQTLDIPKLLKDVHQEMIGES